MITVALHQYLGPLPSKKVRCEVVAVQSWVTSFKAENMRLPLRAEFEAYKAANQTSRLLKYQPNDDGTYRLEHWDGERSWCFASQTGEFTAER